MSDDRPAVDLVAVAYKAIPETEAMLESASLDISTPFTLTIVDNATPDPAMRPLLDRAASIVTQNPMCVRFRVIQSRENVGYARACNLGAALGQAPYIGLLNCDIQFTLGSIETILGSFERPDYTDVGIIGPRTTTSDGKLTHGGIITNNKGRDEHRFWLMQDGPGAWDEFDVPTVSGATYFIRRQLWEELTSCELYQQVAPAASGAFLPTDHFYEETFCSYHARAHGWRIRYQGTAHLIHEWHRSSPVGSIQLGPAEEYFRRACAAHDIPLTF